MATRERTGFRTSSKRGSREGAVVAMPAASPTEPANADLLVITPPETRCPRPDNREPTLPQQESPNFHSLQARTARPAGGGVPRWIDRDHQAPESTMQGSRTQNSSEPAAPAIEACCDTHAWAFPNQGQQGGGGCINVWC